jgi:O-antigen/teichoic acid export membrane protein
LDLGPRTFHFGPLSRLRKLASDTAVYGLSTILGRVLNFLLVPFYTHVFATDEYGVVGLVYGAFVFLNILFTYGLESAYLKYAAGDEGRARVSTVFSTATWSLLITSVVLGGLFLLLPDVLALVSGVTGADGTTAALSPRIVGLAVAILVLDTLAVVPFAELRLEGRPWYFALVRVAGILVNIGLNVWLIVGLGRGVEAVFEANVAASALTLVLLVPLYVRHLRPRFEGSLWRDLVAFGLPFVPGGLGYALTERASLFGLEGLPARVPGATGTDQVGLFNATWKLGVFMMLVVQMFRFAWQPFFLQHAKDADAKPLFARVFTLLAAGLWGLFLVISFFAREIATFPIPGGRTLIGPSFLPGLVVVPLALAAYLFQGWYYVFSAGLYIEKQTKYFAHATFVGSLLAVGATFALVPTYGIVGAGWANVAGYAAMAAVLYRYAQRAYPVPFDWRRVGGASLLALALFAAWARVPALQRWWVEMALIAAFTAGLAGLGVVPRGLVARLRRRPSRPDAPPEEPGESARAGARMADLAGDPAAMAEEDPEPDGPAR